MSPIRAGLVGVAGLLCVAGGASPQDKADVKKLGPATGIPFDRIREFRDGRMVEREAAEGRVFLAVRAAVPPGKVRPYTDFKLTDAGKGECYCCGVAGSERDLLGSFQDFYPSDEVALAGGGGAATLILCYSVPRAYKKPLTLHFGGAGEAVKVITEVEFEIDCLAHPDEKTREKAAAYLGARGRERGVALPALKKALESETSAAVKGQIAKSIGQLEKEKTGAGPKPGPLTTEALLGRWEGPKGSGAVLEFKEAGAVLTVYASGGGLGVERTDLRYAIDGKANTVGFDQGAGAVGTAAPGPDGALVVTTLPIGRLLTKGLDKAEFRKAPAKGPKDDAARAELDRLQGTWVWAASEEGGKENNSERAEFLSFAQVRTFTGDRWTTRAKLPGDQAVTVSGTVRLDPTTTPKGIDLTYDKGLGIPAAGTTERGVYEVDGDTLRLALDKADKGGRPAAVRTKAGDKFAVHIYKRKKPAGAGDRKIDPQKLVGKWAPEKAQDGPALTFEFTGDGKVVVAVTAGGKETRAGGTYKLDGSELTITPAAGGEGRPATLTIASLTEDELVMTGAGEEQKLRRVGGAPAAADGKAGDEKAAADLLRRAKLYAQGEDSRPTYIAKLQAIVTKYPGTAAAKEARRLQDGLK